MPFKSEAQRRYLFANEPKVAKRFAEDAKKQGILTRNLPEKVAKKKK